MASEYEMSVNDYLAIVKHHALLIILSGAAILGVCLAVALSLPPTYESSGTILVESQQISTDLVGPNNTQRASFHHTHAQKEHRMLADQIGEIFTEVFPNIGKIVEDGMPMYLTKEEIKLIEENRKGPLK